jgi:site-specific DNA-methyltransferase (adenine-specific)
MSTIKLLQGDSLTELKKIESNIVDLVVTSPPYNKNYWLRNRHQKGKRIITYDEYHDSLEPQEYIKQQKKILDELMRIIKPTGSIYYNHIDILHKHNTIHPSYVYDYNVKQVIVWDRGNTPKLDKSYFLPTTEWLFWIKKDFNSVPYFNKSLATHKKSIWRINKEKNNQHPAPFPEELVDNIVKSSCPENGLVLDCYNGSGTTGVVAVKNNMEYIGIDISEQYIEMTKERIENERKH